MYTGLTWPFKCLVQKETDCDQVHSREQQGLQSQTNPAGWSNLTPEQEEGDEEVAELEQQLWHHRQADAGRHNQFEDQISLSDAPSHKNVILFYDFFVHLAM